MYLQKVICGKAFFKISFLLASWSWRSMIKIAGSGSGSISQRHESADPDPHQNVMEPQHWLLLCVGRWVVRCSPPCCCWTTRVSRTPCGSTRTATRSSWWPSGGSSRGRRSPTTMAFIISGDEHSTWKMPNKCNAVNVNTAKEYLIPVLMNPRQSAAASSSTYSEKFVQERFLMD